MDQNKKPFHETVAEKLIKQLEEGTAPWQRPWNPGESGAFLPYNPATDNRYKGINSLYLLSQDRDDQRWMTYKQATEAGAQVRKGEKGTGIQYWKFADEHIKKDAAGKPLIDSDGKPVKEFVKLERPRVFFATVFNAEQIEGLPPLQRKPQTWDPIERAEGILATCGVAIHYNGSDRAFYRPSTDSIHLPEKGQFPSADSFYLISKILQPNQISSTRRCILTQTNPAKRNCHGHEPYSIPTRLIITCIPFTVWH